MKIRHDYTKYEDVVAVISFEEDEYIFNPQAEDEIADFLNEKIGGRCAYPSDIPVFLEASSWCTLACIGEEYEDDEFTITIMDREELD